MILSYIVFLGLIFGSFLNVCIYRIPKDQSLSFPPSHCTSCSSKIKTYDLIPVLSYILLKGKCRSCSEKISLRYPAIELLTGFLIYGYFFNLNIAAFIFGALIGVALIALIILLIHSMGWGDAEICLLVGLFLGFKLTVLMLLISVVIGAITGIIIFLKKKLRKEYVAFGYFMAIGAIISALFGEKIIMFF